MPCEAFHVPGRNEDPGALRLDQLHEPANGERDGGNAQRHGIDDGCAESLGLGRVPEKVEAGHRRMYLVHKPGAKGGRATQGGGTPSLAA